jgi:hypothetical protein
VHVKTSLLFLWRRDPTRVMASSYLRFLDHTQRRTAVGKDSSGRVISSSHRPLPHNTQHSRQTNIHASGGIRTHHLSRRAAAKQRLRPRGYWDRRRCLLDQSIDVMYESINVISGLVQGAICDSPTNNEARQCTRTYVPGMDDQDFAK